MDNDEEPDKKRRGGRIVSFLIIAALILLVAVCTYTCGYRSPAVIRGAVQPPPAVQTLPASGKKSSLSR